MTLPSELLCMVEQRQHQHKQTRLTKQLKQQVPLADPDNEDWLVRRKAGWTRKKEHTEYRKLDWGMCSCYPDVALHNIFSDDSHMYKAQFKNNCTFLFGTSVGATYMFSEVTVGPRRLWIEKELQSHAAAEETNAL